MRRFSTVSLLFASIVTLAGAPNPTFGQHGGRGSHGGSHGGGSHGGGHPHASGGGHSSHGRRGFNGGGSHGSGRSHASGGGRSSHGGGGYYGGGSRGGGHSPAGGGGRGSRGGGGFQGGEGSHGSGGGHSVGRSPRSGIRAGPQQGGSGSPRPANEFNHSAHPSSSRAFGAHGSTVGDGQWHSFGSGGSSSFATARGPSPTVGDGQWHSFGNHGSPSVKAGGGPSSSWQGGAARSWNGQGRQMPANNSGPAAFSRSATPTWASNRGSTGSDRRLAEPSPKTTGSAISTSRVLSNIENARFSNSGVSRFSSSNSRFGSHVPQFETPALGGRHQFRGGETSFGRESSFGRDAFSFVPDLLGLALAFGTFGSRGFGLFGLGLNLLGSGFDGFGGNGGYGGSGGYGPDCVSGWTPGLVSPYWGPGVITYPLEDLTCVQ
jgi:hypothetical protein